MFGCVIREFSSVIYRWKDYIYMYIIIIIVVSITDFCVHLICFIPLY